MEESYFSSIREKLNKFLKNEFDEVVVSIKYFTKERALNFKITHNYKGDKFNTDVGKLFEEGLFIDEEIENWYENTYHMKNWNVAIYKLFKDGQYESKTWWDEEFQKSIYNT